MKVFLAGATGVVGRRLTVLLRRAGHEVAGTTRSEAKAAALRAIGAVPVLVDAYDADKLKLAVYAVQPDVIIHQLTDLPQVIDPKTLVRSARSQRAAADRRHAQSGRCGADQ